MAASKSKSIKNALVSLLEGLQLDDEPAFSEVKGYPIDVFGSAPFVFVAPGDQTSEKAEIGSSDRTVNLVVTTVLDAKDDGSDIDYMYDLTDLIIDALDTADFENQLNDIDPTLGAYLLDVSRGDWYKPDTQAGPLLAVDINVAVSYTKDN